MNSKNLFWFLAVVLFSFPVTTYGATRVVQYAGLASVEVSFGRIATFNTQFVCSVAVVNTGGTLQRDVTVSFINTATGTTTTEICAASLPAQRSCIAMNWPQTTVDTNIHGLCTGTISVTDDNAAGPGSVVATGNMTVIQETAVVGGTLSGAYYASGAAVDGGHGLTGNMSLYCREACAGPPANTNSGVCEVLCGVDSAPSTPYGAISPRTIGGLIEDTSIATAPYPAAVRGSYPKSVVAHAPSYYAGGVIYEMNIGSVDAICNGTPGYLGGPAVGSASFFGNHHTVGASQISQEVLFCGHRHNAPDLFMRSGQTVPIVVNGGMAF